MSYSRGLPFKATAPAATISTITNSTGTLGRHQTFGIATLGNEAYDQFVRDQTSVENAGQRKAGNFPKTTPSKQQSKMDSEGEEQTVKTCNTGSQVFSKKVQDFRTSLF
ncbi:uncharacterized protein LOC144201703 [Stigmatopora nigra]